MATKKFTPNDLKGFSKLVTARKAVSDIEKGLAKQAKSLGMGEGQFGEMIGGSVSEPVPKFKRGKGKRRSPKKAVAPKPTAKALALKAAAKKRVAAKAAMPKTASKEPVQTNVRATRKT